MAQAHVIILAAGKGTRMKSDLPKVLHPVKGVPIVKRILKTIEPMSPQPTLIVGHKAEEVIAATDNKYHYVHQTEQKGTGHAIIVAAPELKDRTDIDSIIMIYGDTPLISLNTLQSISHIQKEKEASIVMTSVITPDFEGDNSLFMNYGRIIRAADGTVDRIVEYKDATEEERACKEVNVGYYCFDAQWLWENISLLNDNNAAKEFYITDLIKIAKDQGKLVIPYAIEDRKEALGINTPEQLKMVEALIH